MEIGTTLGPFYDRIETTPNRFSFVEPALDRETVASLSETDAAALGDRIDAAGFDCTVHLPSSVPLISPIPEVRTGIVEFQDRALELAAAMDASRGVAHATTPPRDPAPPETLTETVDRLAGRAADHGVELVVENLGHLDDGYPLETVGERVTETDAALCLDAGHAFLESGTDALAEFAATYADRVAHVHLHDARERGDSHLPLGAGDCDPERIAPAVDSDTTVACEVFTDDRALARDTADRALRALTDQCCGG